MPCNSCVSKTFGHRFGPDAKFPSLYVYSNLLETLLHGCQLRRSHLAAALIEEGAVPLR